MEVLYILHHVGGALEDISTRIDDFCVLDGQDSLLAAKGTACVTTALSTTLSHFRGTHPYVRLVAKRMDLEICQQAASARHEWHAENEWAGGCTALSFRLQRWLRLTAFREKTLSRTTNVARRIPDRIARKQIARTCGVPVSKTAKTHGQTDSLVIF